MGTNRPRRVQLREAAEASDEEVRKGTIRWRREREVAGGGGERSGGEASPLSLASAIGRNPAVSVALAP